MFLEYLLPVFYASGFILLIWKIKFFGSHGLSKKSISAIFITKIIFGIILWAIYTYHYTYRNTSDAYRFFDDATIIFNSTKGHFIHFVQIVFGINSDAEYLKPYLAQTAHWYHPTGYGLINDDRTLIRFNAIILFFSCENYHVHTIFMNFLSLVGLIALYKTFASILPDRKTELFFSVFLIPTVLFWGSGVLKEGLILFALGMFVYAFFKIVEQKVLSAGIFSMLVLSLLLLTIVKTYVIICLIPAIISMVVIKFSGQNKTSLKFFITHLILILFALNIHHIFPDYNVLETLWKKQHDFYNVAQLWNAGSAIDIGRLEPNIGSFIKQIPQALATVFFRPHILETDSVFLLLSAIENLAVLMLLVFYLFHYHKPRKEKISWLLLCSSFILFLALLIGWTTPVMGAIVRYKLPLLPFVLFALIIISKKPPFVLRFEKILKGFPGINP